MELKKKFSVLLVVLLLGGLAAGVMAQPSIPRRYSTSKKTTKSYTRSGVTWGTEYDWLGQRYATWNDIRNKDAGQIRVLKNSIYARHGYIFKDANLRSYFNSRWWYNGYRSTVPMSSFNKWEKANIQFLGKYDH